MKTSSRHSSSPTPASFLVMGVSGSGKSHIGRQLAAELGALFIDGDDFHSEESIAKMSGGAPLTDADREGWLRTLSELYRQHRERNETLVIGCSALKRGYRDLLRQGAPELEILYLSGTRAVLLERLNSRGEHFFAGEHMLLNQLETLEVPDEDEAIHCDIRQMPRQIVMSFLDQRSARRGQ